jgi:hypothetical protein
MRARFSPDNKTQMFGFLRNSWAYGATMALQAPAILQGNTRARTGGPDPDGEDDESDQLRRLMPILAVVITVATVFGN